MTARRVLAGLCVAVAAPSAAEPARWQQIGEQARPVGGAPDLAEGVLSRLPAGIVRTAVDRLPDERQDALIKAARPDLNELARAVAVGSLTPAAADKELEGRIAVRAAFIGAARDPQLLTRAAPQLKEFRPADFATAGFARNVFDTEVGKALLSPGKAIELANAVIMNAPLMYKPIRPINEGEVEPTDRLPEHVDRPSFRSVVGIGRREGSEHVFHCSGVLLDARTVLTAHHCVNGPGDTATPSPLLVFSHFTGGAQTARRTADDKRFKNLSVHPVGSVATETHDRPGEGPWPYDLAVVRLQSAIPGVSGFASRSANFPEPTYLTAAGWGLSDAAPVKDVALEVTIVAIEQSNGFRVTPPTLVSWPVDLAHGGRFCRADSGGPIFSGVPDSETGTMSFALVGLVAAGNNDCRSGEQFLTDLTSKSAREMVCRLASGTTFCR